MSVVVTCTASPAALKSVTTIGSALMSVSPTGVVKVRNIAHATTEELTEMLNSADRLNLNKQRLSKVARKIFDDILKSGNVKKELTIVNNQLWCSVRAMNTDEKKIAYHNEVSEFMPVHEKYAVIIEDRKDIDVIMKMADKYGTSAIVRLIKNERKED